MTHVGIRQNEDAYREQKQLGERRGKEKPEQAKEDRIWFAMATLNDPLARPTNG